MPVDTAVGAADIAEMVTKRVYPDTPVAMHYRPFEEIDWCHLVSADEVVLVITPVFLREIDDHKDHKRGALQDRARRMSGWLGSLRKTKSWTIRSGVRVEVTPREPERDLDFSAHGLEPSVNDDKILACMLRDQKLDPGTPIVCVTSDNTLAYKADAAGFAVVEPPAHQRLEDEPDPLERENRQLKQRIVDLEKRRNPSAELSLEFDGGSSHRTFTFSGLEEPTEADIEEEIEAERAALDLQRKLLTVMYRPPSATAVEAYLKGLRDWAVEHKALAIMRAHTFDVQAVLVNAGTGNAEDIEIDLRFPEQIFVAEKRDVPNQRPRPNPPRPEHANAILGLARSLDFMKGPSALAALQVGSYDPVLLDSLDSLDSDGPHHLRIFVHRIKHQSQIDLPPFQAWAENGFLPNGFQISYRIHAASSPEIPEGVLHVRLDARRGPARVLRQVPENDDAQEESDDD